MSLILEDGTGVLGANTYVTLDEYRAYHIGVSGDATHGDSSKITGAAITATMSLGGKRWKGAPANGRSQPLAWPRRDVVDANGLDVSSTEIPQEVKLAQMATMYAIIADGHSPFGVSDPATTLKSFKVDIITEVYAIPDDPAKNTQSLPHVDQIISGLVLSASGLFMPIVSE